MQGAWQGEPLNQGTPGGMPLGNFLRASWGLARRLGRVQGGTCLVEGGLLLGLVQGVHLA